MESKGKLIIFFGYSAGVGKTYAMLKEAHEQYLDGQDIVIGYIEPHERKDTLELMEGLECIPTKTITYKNHDFKEFDLDAALERHPQIILVDELAHTNAPGSRHQKRYQDVQELLRAGIDVYTTLNVQHLESLHDIVQSITHIKVNERIPDHVFDEADDIRVVDTEVDKLLERLQSGKIYHQKQVQRALDNFFTKENLIALKEIALRRMADRINLYSDEKNKPFLKEHILVCISPSPTNQKVIRTASRMAMSVHGEFSALVVETSKDKDFTDKERDMLEKNLNLARHLEANIVSTYGDDIAFQISQFATVSGISKLVLGRSTQKISLLRKTTIVDQITQLAPNLEIYIIPDAHSVPRRRIPELRWDFKFSMRDSLVTLLITLVTTALSFLVFNLGLSTTNIVLLYVLASCIIGFSTQHPIYNLIGTILNILFIDFFFVDPFYSFGVSSTDYPMVFLIMAIVSLIITNVQDKLKKENILAAKRAHSMDVLLETSQSLQSTKTYEEIMNETLYQLHKLLDRPIIFYPVDRKTLGTPVIYLPHKDLRAEQIFNSSGEKAVAKWVLINNKNAGATTSTLSQAHGLYFSIRKGEKIYAVIGIDMTSKKELTINEKSLLQAILNEIALAMDSLRSEKNGSGDPSPGLK